MFVPKHSSANVFEVEKLYRFIDSSRKLLVLTGAGVSTESGIPDYRSEGVGLYNRPRKEPYRPIQQSQFLSSREVRRRYWLKNYIGWPTFSTKSPNETHLSIANLEKVNKVICTITQNVDNLHYKAKTDNVIELHGSAFRVKCLSCNEMVDRERFQNSLRLLNPDLSAVDMVLNPDGDVDIDEIPVECFKVPNCAKCDGILQPDIVFFGGTVPAQRNYLVEENVNKCDSLLVLGTTLQVYSSYRIILRAYDNKKPIFIVNIGQTRGDSLATYKINARCGEVIPFVSDRILVKK